MTAFNEALALESASDLPYKNGKYKLNSNELVEYAKIVAYKTAYNLKNGIEIDWDKSPLITID